MVYLILCIAANVGIFSCFRAFKYYGVNTFQAIVFNYLVCVITGTLFAGWSVFDGVLTTGNDWLPYAVGLGFIFIGTFYLMARTTQVFSMTVSSIATKMSLIIPVLFSLIILNIQSKDYTAWNYLGMVVALIAIMASSFKPGQADLHSSKVINYLLPFSVFVLGGIIDSTINFVSFRFLSDSEEAVFPIFIFMSAGFLGLLFLILQRKRITTKSLLGGAVLGVVNYFSVYFLVRSLSVFSHDGALVYPLINVGIILVATGVSALFFRENFSRLNIAGVVLAVAAILLLSYQEIISAG